MVNNHLITSGGGVILPKLLATVFALAYQWGRKYTIINKMCVSECVHEYNGH